LQISQTENIYLYISQKFELSWTANTHQIIKMKDPETKELQMRFLKSIEELIPSNTSLVNELSDVLQISMDSAYRRMRGETLLNINEITHLCGHYRISFDAFANIKAGLVNFSYLPIEPLAENFALYHKSLLYELNLISSSNESKIIYACQDIPVFHHYSFPDLANFKVFYWKKSIMGVPELAQTKFGVDTNFSDQLEIGQAIIDAYSRVPSVEIWTDTTIQSTLKQIRFYWDSGSFNSKEDALRICMALRNEMENLQLKAEYGTKLSDKNAVNGNSGTTKEDKPVEPGTNYQLYVSEIELTNNCVLVNVGTNQTVYLGHFSFSTMSTRNEVYCKKTEGWFNNIIRKSNLISGVSERLRYQFFKTVFQKIDALVNYIEND
jgi:hypothetical protein